MEVVATLHRSLCRAGEWGLPLIVLSIDVHAAFGSLVTEHGGACHCPVAAVLHELVRARAQPRVGQVRGGWQPLEKGVQQG